MNRRNLTIVVTLLSLLKCVVPQDKPALQGQPAYAVAVPHGTPEQVVLRCSIDGQIDEDNLPSYFWLDPSSTIISSGTMALLTKVSPKLNVQSDSKELTLAIDSVSVDDRGSFTCQLSTPGFTLKANVELHVNRLPIVGIKQVATPVMEGKESTIADCTAGLSKPPPEMWFEDSKGNKLTFDDAVEVKECGSGLTNSTLTLTKTFMRADMQEEFVCKIKHVNRTEPYTKKLEAVNVLYAPSAEFIDPNFAHGKVLLEEDDSFSVLCKVDGNPKPTVSWLFKPDNSSYVMERSNNINSQSVIPDQFILTDGDQRLFTSGVVVSDNVTTNNGTFTCTASNSVGPDATVSFHLSVYARPTTTEPPTTTAAFVSTKITTTIASVSSVPPTPEPIRSGPSAAVIAGIVGVAVFILIVTIILLLKYFTSHKGEYYTQEKSNIENGLEGSDDEAEFSGHEEDLLREKKRPEHFL